MKKVLTLLVAVVAIMVCVVGCGEGNSSSSNLLTFDEYITKYNEYCANELEEKVNREKEMGQSGEFARQLFEYQHPLYPLSRDLFVEDATSTVSGQYYYANAGFGLNVNCTAEDTVMKISHYIVFSEEDYLGLEDAYMLISTNLESIFSPFWEDTTELVNIFTELNEELIDSGEQYATREEDNIIYSIDIQEADGRIGVSYSVDFVH